MIKQTNIRAFANLMAKIDTLKSQPAGWKNMLPTRAAE
jgi:hypothetical protein